MIYNNFFGEYSADDYDLNARLERLCRVRSMISMYVDEPALERLRKAQSYNYGDVLNYWVMYISDKNETRETVIEKFKATLYEWGVLNMCLYRMTTYTLEYMRAGGHVCVL